MEDITIFKNFTTVMGYRSLPMIVKAIRDGVYKDEILSIRRAVARGDKKLVDQLKKQLQAFTVSGKFEGGRTVKHMVAYFPFVILDIDKLEEKELKRITAEIHQIAYTHISFKSPSGNGCKIIVKVGSSFSQHQEAFKQVVKFYESKLRIKVDQSGKDVMRLCFFSYDPDIFYNKKSKIFAVQPNDVNSLFGNKVTKSFEVKNKAPFKNLSSDVLEKLDQALALTKQKITYSPGNRNNFIYLFACNCNRESLNISDVLLYSKNQFDLPEGEMVATVKSAFVHHERDRGSNVRKKSTKQWQFLEAQESFYASLAKTPCFPKSVYASLPKLFSAARHRWVVLGETDR